MCAAVMSNLEIIAYLYNWLQERQMGNELFFKKVYSVAFRLTGEKSKASKMAELAIAGIVKEPDMDNKITSNIFQLTIIELVNIFLKAPNICYNDTNDYINDTQRALLSLKPVSRTIVIWKDLLGFQISDNMPAANYTRQELLMELSCGRRELREYLLNKIR